MILTPLRYCESRLDGNECTRFAEVILRGMPFCLFHQEKLVALMDEAEVEFVSHEGVPEEIVDGG